MSSDRSKRERPLLSVSDLVPRIGDRLITRPVSFLSRPRDLGVLTGSNGSGKTSVLRAILGEMAHLGNVLVLGRSPALGRPWEAARNQLRLLPQFPVLPSSFTLAEVLSVWMAAKPDHGIPDRDGCLEMTKMLARVEPASRIGALSFGQRRLVELAIAFHVGTRVILADEPLAGLSPTATRGVVQAAERFVGTGGTFVATAHKPERRHWEPSWALEVCAA